MAARDDMDAVDQLLGRRASERVDLEVEVDFESDHNFYTGLSENVSAGGLFIATYALRSVGSRLTVRFTVPGYEKPIDVAAVVHWLREGGYSGGMPGMGVRFEGLNSEEDLAIRAFVGRRGETIFFDDE